LTRAIRKFFRIVAVPVAACAAMLLAGGARAQSVLGGGKGGAPSFPITITQSGSYKLAANLNVPAGSDGIVIASGLNVTLDLNGFEVAGPVRCTKGGCNANTMTTGIKIGSSSVRIHSGTVCGFGSAGIGVSYENGKYGFDIGFGMYDGLMAQMNAMGNKLSGAAGANGFY
jgi:hypothetical protein